MTIDRRGLIAGAAALILSDLAAEAQNNRRLMVGLSQGKKKSASPLPFLRVVTPLNGSYSQGVQASGTQNTFAFRAPIQIAQDCAQLVLSFSMWAITNAGDVGIGNALTVLECYIDSGTATQQVLFSGVGNTSVADLTVDFHSDAVNPLAAKTKFTNGETYFIKLIVSVPATTGKVPARTNPPGQSVTGYQSLRYDPAVTTASSGVTPGAYTFTGTAPAVVGGNSIYVPIVLGYPYVDQLSLIAAGDSEISALTDTGSALLVNGNGYFQRALTALDGLSNPRPALNFSVSGQGTPAMTGSNNRWASFCKYANTGFPALLTNDITGATTLDTATSDFLLIVQLMRLGGVKRIIRPELFPNTTSTDGFSTVGNQTGQSGWTAGAVAPQTNSYFATKLNDGVIQSILSASDFRDATTTIAWEASGTTSISGNVTIGSGSPNLLLSTGVFTSNDVGKQIIVPGAGAAGGLLSSTILTFTDATHVVLANNASTALTASAQTVSYGQPTADGKHPTTPYHIIHGTSLRNLLATFPNSDPAVSSLPPVLNPNDCDSALTLSNGNLTATHAGATGGNPGVRCTTGNTTGKYYFEFVIVTAVNGIAVCIADIGAILNNNNNAHCSFYANTGTVGGAGASGSGFSSYTSGDVICGALDIDNKRISWRKNGGNWNNNVANDPGTGFLTMSSFVAGVQLFPAMFMNAQTESVTARFSGFGFSVPSGYSAITGGGV